MDTFLTKEELKTVAPLSLLQSLSSPDEGIVEQIIKENIDRIGSYLQGRYDTDAIFAARGEARAPVILKYLKDLVIYDLYARQGHGQVGEAPRLRHQEALNWLKEIGQGLISPDLPLRASRAKDTPMGSASPYKHRF